MVQVYNLHIMGMKGLVSTLFAAVILITAAEVCLAQQSDIETAIGLISQKDYPTAIEVLRRIVKNDHSNSPAWFYLGQAYDKSSKKGEAGDAFHKAFETGYSGFRERFVQYADSPKTSRLSEFIKSEKSSISMTISSASAAAKLKGDDFFDNYSRLRTNALYGLLQIETLGEPAMPGADRAMTILRKPHAQTPVNAKWIGQDVTVLLMVVFGSDGKVHSAIPLGKPQPSFDVEAMKAAWGIEFEPARKDGKLLTIMKRVEYSFHTQ